MSATSARQPQTLWSSNDCPSGKRAFGRRRDAATALRRQFPGEHMRPYRCSDCGCWHVGHLPRLVMTGAAVVADVYPRRGGTTSWF